MPVAPEKEKAIELAVSSIEKAFGKGSIMRLGNEEPGRERGGGDVRHRIPPARPRRAHGRSLAWNRAPRNAPF